MPNPDACPVCASEQKALQRTHPVVSDVKFYSCPRCGIYGLTGTAQAALPALLKGNRNRAALFGHALQNLQRKEALPIVEAKVAETILKNNKLPTAQEQADNLIRWLGDNATGPGEPLKLSFKEHGFIVGAKSDDGFNFVLLGLKDTGAISAAPGGWILTFEGWRRYEELRKGATSGRVAFMAMQYGDTALDRIVNDHIRPAVEQTGFTLKRLDDQPKAGLIDDRLRVEIRGSTFLIADLSHENRGAYWEAGYAEGLGKPVIYTCEESKFEKESSHFDTNHHLTVLWSKQKIEDAMEQLKATIRATIPEAKQNDT
jgi:hypothetical protein